MHQRELEEFLEDAAGRARTGGDDPDPSSELEQADSISNTEERRRQEITRSTWEAVQASRRRGAELEFHMEQKHSIAIPMWVWYLIGSALLLSLMSTVVAQLTAVPKVDTNAIRARLSEFDVVDDATAEDVLLDVSRLERQHFFKAATAILELLLAKLPPESAIRDMACRERERLSRHLGGGGIADIESDG